MVRSVAEVMTALTRDDFLCRLDLPEPVGELLDFQLVVNGTVKLLQERAQK